MLRVNLFFSSLNEIEIGKFRCENFIHFQYNFSSEQKVLTDQFVCLQISFCHTRSKFRKSLRIIFYAGKGFETKMITKLSTACLNYLKMLNL